jgi:ketosteroid isomerase-like protein
MPGTHRSFALLGPAMLLLSAGGCQKAEHRGGVANNREADIAAIKDAIQADQDKWNDEYNAQTKNAQSLAAHYASDAYIVPVGLDPVGGTRNIRRLFGAIARDPNFKMTFAGDRIEVSRSGDLAFVRGRFSDRYTDPATNQVKSEAGTFLTVYKKQDDGSWKVIEDFTVHDATPRRPPM